MVKIIKVLNDGKEVKIPLEFNSIEEFKEKEGIPEDIEFSSNGWLYSRTEEEPIELGRYYYLANTRMQIVLF